MNKTKQNKSNNPKYQLKRMVSIMVYMYIFIVIIPYIHVLFRFYFRVHKCIINVRNARLARHT